MKNLREQQFLREERNWFKCTCWKKWEGDRTIPPENYPIPISQYDNISLKSYYYMGDIGTEKLDFKYNQNLTIPILVEEEKYYTMTDIKYKDLKDIAKIIDSLNDIFCYDIIDRTERDKILELREKIQKIMDNKDSFL